MNGLPCTQPSTSPHFVTVAAYVAGSALLPDRLLPLHTVLVSVLVSVRGASSLRSMYISSCGMLSVFLACPRLNSPGALRCVAVLNDNFRAFFPSMPDCMQHSSQYSAHNPATLLRTARFFARPIAHCYVSCLRFPYSLQLSPMRSIPRSMQANRDGDQGGYGVLQGRGAPPTGIDTLFQTSGTAVFCVLFRGGGDPLASLLLTSTPMAVSRRARLSRGICDISPLLFFVCSYREFWPLPYTSVRAVEPAFSAVLHMTKRLLRACMPAMVHARHVP